MHVTVAGWLDAFFFTQVVEVPIYVLAMRHALRDGYAARRVRLAGSW